MSAWSPDFEPPEPPQTERIRLAVLSPDVVEMDYAAIMGSRVRLRQELEWGGWPDDAFTLEKNRVDLAEHLGEFARREAYAYTVLDATGETVVGCIYLGQFEGTPRLSFWVTDAEVDTGLEAHLVETVLSWVEAAWPWERLLVLVRPWNERGVGVLTGVGLERQTTGGPDGYASFAWRRLPG